MKRVPLLFNKATVLGEANRLYRLGFAIHWLKEKSKMPVGAKWTTGSRRDWIDLKDDYRDGMNIGVRLGEASKLPGGYLGVIDCDVKSTDPKHKREMLDALKKIFPQANEAPRVLSGRGNGSMHLYVLTKEPGSPRRLTQSSDSVEVHMPSVRASKRDLESLGEAKVKKGLRLRAAWEIAFMGQGQQVVLPPSIHPDSGKTYKWDKAFIKSAPIFSVKDAGPLKSLEPIEDFKFEAIDVDLDLLDISTVDRELIRSGANCSDRSVGLYIAASALVKAGLGDDEILSILTDTDNYLGEAAFDHAQTSSRHLAARWVKRYTLDKARQEFSAQEDFKDAVVVADLEPVAAAEQKESLAPEDWKLKIERNQYRIPKNTLKNVILILENEIGPDIFLHNEFAGQDIYGRETPWGGLPGVEIKDRDIISIKIFIATKFSFEPSNDKLNEAVSNIANKNKFHPVRKYLNALEWDGISRVDSFLETYFGAEGNTVYLRAVSRKVLCAMVARVFEPGVKFDNILIIEGRQGIGKSTAIRYLTSDAWFSDTHLNVADKDSVMNIQGHWVLELGEIASLRKADLELLKAFVSRPTDKIRVPYGKRTEVFPRQCVFIGTKNPDGEYLKDPTGNRRFWPVGVTKSDFRAILNDRDQLFAEAKALWELGETLYLDDDEAAAGALKAQHDRTVEDPLVEQACVFFSELRAKPEKDRNFPLTDFSMLDVVGSFGPFPKLTNSTADALRAGHALRAIGFERIVKKVDGKTRRLWRLKNENPTDHTSEGKNIKNWAVKGVAGSA